MARPPFPFSRNGNYPPAPGMLHDVPAFCKNKFRPECREYYNNIHKRPGFHQCPFGFASYTTPRGSITYTCLRVSAVSHKKKLKTVLGASEVPQTSKALVERAASVWEPTDQLHIRYTEAKDAAATAERFINSTMHEIRRLNGLIKAGS